MNGARTKTTRGVAIALILLFCLPFVAAHADNPDFDCDCRGRCECYIQFGDSGNAVKGIVLLLREYGYVGEKQPYEFDAALESAVLDFQYDCGLLETGVMDNDTLTMLIWGVTAEERAWNNPDAQTRVWVPTDGGKKCHRKPTCSGMYNPRKVTRENAIELDMQPCGRCKP